MACGLFLLAACVKNDKPTSLPPEVWVNEADDVTRHTASLSGGVRHAEDTRVSECRFWLGTSVDELHEVAARVDGQQATADVEGLESGTDYYFCLEAGNGRQQVRSKVLRFRTVPDMPVQLGQVEVVGQTPFSLWLSCPVIDDGGGNIRSIGFAYRASGEEQETEVEAERTSDNALRVLLSSLKRHTQYAIRAFAINSMGKSYSESFSVTTGDAVTYAEAGSLSKVVGEAERYAYASITIVAPMNGDDFRFLRSMGGCGVLGEPSTPGRLADIDLSGVSIVEGGCLYDGSRPTMTDVVTVGMFSDMPELTRLVLPMSAVRVEVDAVSGSAKLESLTLPLSVQQVTASAGCAALGEINISTANESYSSIDGLLYNKAGTELVWYPRGKKADRLVLPATLTAIKKFTFEGCSVREIVLPETLLSIENNAFAGSAIESIVLSDKMSRLDDGLFLQCSQLKAITLGSGMDYICNNAFKGCPLAELRVRAEIPPVCQTDAFAGVDMGQCMVYVPKGCKSAYKSHAVWCKFVIKEMEE